MSGNSLPATVSLGAVEKIQMVALQEIQLFLQAGSLRIEIDLEIREVMAINSVTRPKSSRANSRSQPNEIITLGWDWPDGKRQRTQIGGVKTCA